MSPVKEPNKYENLAQASREETKRIIRCTRKRKFSSKEEALKCNKTQKPYRCKDCGGWHLSGAHLRDSYGANLPSAKLQRG